MRAEDLDVCRFVIAWSLVDEVIVFPPFPDSASAPDPESRDSGFDAEPVIGRAFAGPVGIAPPEPLAAGLARRGVRPGEFVLLHLENSIEAMLGGIRKKRKRHAAPWFAI